MYLSSSGYKLFKTCPRHYWHKYVDKTPLKWPDNKVNSLFGSIVGRVFEEFYSQRAWKQPKPLGFLLSRTRDLALKVIFAEESKGGVIRYKDKDSKANYESFEALYTDVREAIPRGLLTIKENRFIGTEAEAEVKLDFRMENHIIGGRADFVIRRFQVGDLVILDGKGSKWREKYVDNEQLLWYAMLHKLSRGVAPDKLAFVYWRFEGEEAVGWLPYDPGDIPEFQAKVLETMDRMAQMKIKSEYQMEHGSWCKLCEYLDACDGVRLR